METKTATVAIRGAAIDDAEQIGRLITELGYATTTEAMRARLAMNLVDPDYVTFVAEMATGVVGVAGARLGRYYEKDGVYSQLVVLAVSATARREGVGTQLVAAVEHWVRSKGGREVIVNSGLHRHEARFLRETRICPDRPSLREAVERRLRSDAGSDSTRAYLGA